MFNKRIWIAVLVAVLCVCSCILFIGCEIASDDTPKDNTDKIWAVYQIYVQNKTEREEQPLSYDDWLSSIKGEKGDAGRGIANLVIDNDGNLIVTFTDDTVVNLGKVCGTDGKNGIDGSNGAIGEKGEQGDEGLSAYELYKKYHPDYQGSEEQWISEFVRQDASPFDFYLTDDDTYMVAAGRAKYLSKIVIPAYYNGRAVTEIVEEGFANCGRIKSVELPDTITTINQSAFSGCNELESLVLGNGVKTIGAYAFSGCSELESVVLGNGLKTIGAYAFQNCEKLKTIVVPDGIESIDMWAFYSCNSLDFNVYDNAYYLGNTTNPYVVLVKAVNQEIVSCDVNEEAKLLLGEAFIGCSNLENIDLKSVQFIGDAAFAGSGLTSVVIPSSVRYIECNSWFDCKLSSIAVQEGNLRYKSVNNCLVDTQTGMLVATCNGSVLPNDGSVVSVGAWAFASCPEITSVVIPDGVASIGIGAFGHSQITHLVIPDSVVFMGSWAFFSCEKLTSINYLGTMEQWGKIQKNMDWNYNSSIATIICSDGTISL